MQRRTLLRAGAAALGTATVGGRAAANRRRAEWTRQDEYGPLGSLEVESVKEAVPGDGDVAHLAVGDGYATVDLSDPADPTLLAERRGLAPGDDDRELASIWDVKYADGLLLVMAQTDFDRDERFTGFLVVDVSDPADPERVLFHETSFRIHNGFFDGELAYLGDGAGSAESMSVYDVSGGTAERLGGWSVLDGDPDYGDAYGGGAPNAHDLRVRGELAYLACWDAGTWIVDVSDPAEPRAVSRVGGLPPDELAGMDREQRRAESFRPPGNDHYVATDAAGELMGVGAESWTFEGEGGPSGIDLYDVSDPADPVELASIDPPEPPNAELGTGVATTAHNFEFHGGVLYSSWYGGGVRRHDVTDPAAPELLTEWRRPTEASMWTARTLVPGETFLASSKGVPSADAPARLYVFPDAAGRSVEPFPEPEATPTPGEAPDSTGTPTDDATATTEGRTDGDDATTTADPADPSDPGTTVTNGPGFGALAALGAAGLGARRVLRDR